MSPFRSKAQSRAAYSGALGSEMKKKAPRWAHETPHMADLPERSGKKLKEMMMRSEAMRRMKKAH